MTDSNKRHEATIQMYAAVGRAITQWGFVEERLFQVFTVCVGTALPLDEMGIAVLDSWIPMCVFYSLESFHAKRTILDAALTAYVTGVPQAEELCQEWGKLSQKGRELSRKRNKLAHWTVYPAQIREDEEGFVPARLMPTIGSPNYWQEKTLRPKGKSLTEVQVGHIEKAFCLYGNKVWAFAHKLTDTAELRDKDVRRALRLLMLDSRLALSVREQLQHFDASLQ